MADKDIKKEEKQEEKKYKVEEVKSETSEEAEEQSTKEKTESPADTDTKTPSETQKPADDQKISSFKLADVKESSNKTQETTEQKPEAAPTEEPKTTDVNAEEKKEEKPADKSHDWLSDVKTDDEAGENEEKEGGKKKIFIIILVIILLGALVGGGIYYYQTQINKNGETTEVEKEELVVVPTIPVEEGDKEEGATESAEVELDVYEVNILNGSGIAGEAGKVSTLLELAGFDNIDTANADSYDFVNTEISLKEDIPNSVYREIKESLEDTYIVEKLDDPLGEDYDYDIEIVVGSQKAESSE
jgi:hypothetical protein